MWQPHVGRIVGNFSDLQKNFPHCGCSFTLWFSYAVAFSHRVKCNCNGKNVTAMSKPHPQENTPLWRGLTKFRVRGKMWGTAVGYGARSCWIPHACFGSHVVALVTKPRPISRRRCPRLIATTASLLWMVATTTTFERSHIPFPRGRWADLGVRALASYTVFLPLPLDH
jgi:hypothetical protein